VDSTHQSSGPPAATAADKHKTRRLSRAAELARSPLWIRPGFLIRRLNQIHYAMFLDECAEFGITPVQYGALTVLAMNPELDQASLAAELGIDRTTVAGVLTRLTARGLVSRRPSVQDRRMKLATLTAEGEQVTARMKASMQRAQTRLLEPLAPAERAAFMDYLTQLVEASNDVGRAFLRFP
jgi:DNA-binding MarR family transcriptional regulator